MRPVVLLIALFPACREAGSLSDTDPWSDATALLDDTAPGGGGSTDCWQADAALDLSDAASPGAGYAAPAMAVTCGADTVTITANGMPSYTYVSMTPNPLVEQAIAIEIPRHPEVADQPTDIPLLGYAGLTVGGTYWFGPNEAAVPADSAWGDPVYNGIVDGCQGHTADAYHHHALAEKCLTQAAVSSATPWTLPDPDEDTPSPIIGFAADGFPIYGPRGCLDEACTEVATFTSGWVQLAAPVQDAWDNHTYRGDPDDETVLDRCNGRYGPDGTYRYHATATFPDILGCYTGTPLDAGQAGGGADQGGGGQGTPTACLGDGTCDDPAQTCADTPMGERCVPACERASDCPPGPGGQALTCSMEGACVPG